MAVGLAGVLLLASCSSGNSDSTQAQTGSPVPQASSQAPSPAPSPAPSEPATTPDAGAAANGAAPANQASVPASPGQVASPQTPTGVSGAAPKPTASAAKPAASAPASTKAAAPASGNSSAGQVGSLPGPGAATPAPAEGNGGATDVGVTADSVKLGGIFMYGYALGNLAIQPMHREMQSIVRAVNDSGGIFGRRFTYVDCDDGAPDPARTRACYKKLVEQEKVFAFMGGCTFTEAQYQADLERSRIPEAAPCSLYREEWQNPFAFPIHMDMSQEAMGNANWAIQTKKPKTFGILCLNNPEMLHACELAEATFAKANVKQVFKRVYQSGTPDMSGDIIAARTANPDLILHYTVDPTVTVRFFLDAQQQNYWPPKGISGNHMALEVIGGLMGEYPAKTEGGYDTNTTYKLWGSDYIAFQRKYAPQNKGLAHHVTQGQWFGASTLMDAIRAVGPNLTREALLKVLYSKEWATGPSLGQKFMWAPGQRYIEGAGNTHEYMYKYVNKNTYAKDDGTGDPTGFIPDPENFIVQAPAVDPHSGTGTGK
jgi:hypothetical protein